jgi:8-oxo-dGTP pyrophosphatase MutT (NUDIX family)
MEKETIRAALSRHNRKSIAPGPGLTPAAVLLPVFCDGRDCFIVVAKRSQNVTFHKGQYCFPGGGVGMKDTDLMATALRESREEIGLRPEDVEILGQLDDQVTTSSYVVSAYVGYIPHPYTFTSDGLEILDVLIVPIAALEEQSNWIEDERTVDGKPWLGPQVNYQGNIIWGATARILKQFVDILGSR